MFLPGRILQVPDLETVGTLNFHPQEWTAIVPMAGKGSRLGFEKPKALYPILERPILDWILELTMPVAKTTVLVVSPEGENQIRDTVSAAPYSHRIRFAKQSVPSGMADAVLMAKPFVETKYAFVIWGDQIALRPELFQQCMKVHESRHNARLTLPSCQRENPYIAIQRDSTGRIIAVKQAREREVVTSTGENDCGLFFFSSETLFSTLEKARQQASLGMVTNEFNLLPVIPSFDESPGETVTLQVATEEETQGINTVLEAQKVAEILKSRKWHPNELM